MGAIYNELEPFAVEWLRNLETAGHIAPGAVDDRSIEDLEPADVAGPGQRHFFAGIGGWSYALRLAGVPDDASVWTGSCPCQPFSSAGKGLGVRDPRHLWPAWFALIRECRPAIIFGEQVASRDGLAWLDLVFADLERCGYAVGAADLCAASVGAPHIRQRLYFVAYADELAGRQGAPLSGRSDTRVGASSRFRARSWDSSGTHRMGNAHSLASRRECAAVSRAEGANSSVRYRVDRSWAASSLMACADGRRRPVPTESGLFPLAHGVPARVGRLRGYGNAIVPQVAATFIRCALEAKGLV